MILSSRFPRSALPFHRGWGALFGGKHYTQGVRKVLLDTAHAIRPTEGTG